ncbi:MAG: hypothetical protein LCH46_08620 [Proteobacteria bacterium]|nr:hypothetical protein [Pseudomonadota bacterium]
MMKSLITAAVISLSAAGIAATPAKAGVDVNIGLGVMLDGPGVYVGGGHGYGYGYVGPGYGYGYKKPYVKSGISCNEGRWITKSAGYKNVKTKECYGSKFTYVGKRFGNKYIVTVSRWSGNIISVNML